MKQGWEIKTLGEICEFANGLWTGKKPPFINVGVIRNTNFTKDGELDDSDIIVLDVEQSQFAKRKLKYGDIILEKSGGGPKQPVGRVIIFNKKEGNYSFSNFTSVIRIKSPQQTDFAYLHRFLFFSYISGATETMQTHSTGIRNLKFDEYKEIKVPLPPIPNQQRIVAILDEAFASIAKVKANTEQNLKNARELFESYLEDVFTNKGEGWKDKPLNEACLIVNGGTPDTSKAEYWNGEHLWITPKDMGQLDGIYVDNTSRKITEEGLKNSSAKLLPPDSIILSSRAPIGHLAINKRPISTNQGCKGLIPNKDISTLYLFYFLKRSVELLNNLGTGATFRELSSSKLAEVKIPIPKTINEQQSIVQKLEALSAESKKLQAIYQQKLNDLEELKKSILQKVFAGELRNGDLVDHKPGK